MFSHPGGTLPPLVFLLLAAYTAVGAGLAWTSMRRLTAVLRSSPRSGGRALFCLWLTAGTGAAVLLAMGFVRPGAAAVAACAVLGTRSRSS